MVLLLFKKLAFVGRPVLIFFPLMQAWRCNKTMRTDGSFLPERPFNILHTHKIYIINSTSITTTPESDDENMIGSIYIMTTNRNGLYRNDRLIKKIWALRSGCLND